MSIFIHVVSALVFLVLFYIIRQLRSQKALLLQMLMAKAEWATQRFSVVCPVVFLQSFAKVFTIDMRVVTKPRRRILPVNCSIFLDFYLEHGIRDIVVNSDREGRCLVTITPVHSSDDHRLAEVFSNQVEVQLTSA